MKSVDYVVSFKLVKDGRRMKIFSVWVAYLPIRSKCKWVKNPIKRNKVLYSKAAKELYSVYGNAPKFFLPTPIGICALYGENTSCPNMVKFLATICCDFPEEMTLNVGDVYTPVSSIHHLTGNGLMDFKIKLTQLFRDNEGVFKAGWKQKNGCYDGMRIWDFHMGWDYYNGSNHYKFTPNKNFK